MHNYRKLKNRVAAQTSRDRKKAKMDEMDHTVRRLADENAKLKEQFERLTADNEALLQRNIELERSLEELRAHLDDATEELTHKSSSPSPMPVSTNHANLKNIKVESNYDTAPLCDRWMGCGIKNGSAVSSYPLPKGSQILKPQSMRRSDNMTSNYMKTQLHQQAQSTLTPPSTPPPAHQSHPFDNLLFDCLRTYCDGLTWNCISGGVCGDRWCDRRRRRTCCNEVGIVDDGFYASIGIFAGFQLFCFGPHHWSKHWLWFAFNLGNSVAAFCSIIFKLSLFKLCWDICE